MLMCREVQSNAQNILNFHLLKTSKDLVAYTSLTSLQALTSNLHQISLQVLEYQTDNAKEGKNTRTSVQQERKLCQPKKKLKIHTVMQQ